MKVAIKHSEIPNPREFVKSAPIPLPTHTGIKIQARNFQVYNASVPDRDEVRKENYGRRLQQMTSMGFSTPINKPYKVIGEPLYLEQKQIILHGLGQLTYANVNQENTVLNNSDQASDKNKEETSKPVSKFTFGNLKKSKDLIDLQSEVIRTRNFVRCVKLGHSFFDLVKEEEKIKTKRNEEDKRASTTSMQIRPYEDSEDDSELSDEDNDISLQSYMEDISPTLQNSFYNKSYDDINTNRCKTAYTRSISQTINIQQSNNNNNKFVEISMKEFNNNTSNFEQKSSFRVRISDQAELNIRPHTVPAMPRHPKFKSNIASAQSNRIDLTTQSRMTTISKKIKEPPKPYTPIYSSLLSRNDMGLNKVSFARQLSVLLWLLESINVEPPNAIGPLRTCFSLKELGGSKINDKALLKIKSVESEWSNFKKEPGAIKIFNKLYAAKDDRGKPRKRITTNVTSVNDSVMTEDTLNDEELDSLRMLKAPIDTPTSELRDSSIPDISHGINNPSSPIKKEEIRLNLNTVRDSFDATQEHGLSNIVAELPTPFLVNNSELILKTETNRESVISASLKDGAVTSTVRDSLNLGTNDATTVRQPSQRNQQLLDKRRRKPISLRQDTKSQSSVRIKTENTLNEQEMQLLRIGDPDELEHLFTKISHKTEKKNAKELRADTGPIHALWTQNVLNYQKTLGSGKKSAKLQEIKDQFISVTDENAIILHNRLEELERKRLSNCLTKFNFLDVKERGIHKMISKMNKCIAEKQRLEDMRKTPNSQYHQWFLELEDLVETNYKNDDPVLSVLIDKLSIYGKLNAKKMNETAFFKTLDTLRVWELLSPEVMTAVEFCRERILAIPLDQFDSWFMSKHPQSFVPRPELPNRSKSSISFKN